MGPLDRRPGWRVFIRKELETSFNICQWLWWSTLPWLGTRMTNWRPRWRRTCCGAPWLWSRSLSFSLLWFSVAAKGRKGRGWRDDKMVKQISSVEVTKYWDQLKKNKKEKEVKTGKGGTFWGHSSKLPTGDNLSNSQASAHQEVSRRLLEINLKITFTKWFS